MVISNKCRTFALAFEEESNVGAIAQLVEQRTENPCVPGSIPGGTTEKSSSYLTEVTAFLLLYGYFGEVYVNQCVNRGVNHKNYGNNH